MRKDRKSKAMLNSWRRNCKDLKRD